jgi:hypothetical protein
LALSTGSLQEGLVIDLSHVEVRELR